MGSPQFPPSRAARNSDELIEPRFQINETSLAAMQAAGVPELVRQRLEALKDREPATREAFVKDLAEKLGAKIVYVGRDPLDAEIAGRQQAMESGRIFISPYNDPDVLSGQGTIAVELLEQMPDLGAVFVAVGGGGLIGGIGAYLKDVSPRTQITVVNPEMRNHLAERNFLTTEVPGPPHQ